MTRAMWVLALLAVVIVACGTPQPADDTESIDQDPVTEEVQTEAGDEEAAPDTDAGEEPDESVAEGAESDDSSEAVSEGSGEAEPSNGEEGAGGDTEEPQEQPTPDPTIVAVAQNFELPLLGDPEAPLYIYEFSDYLCPYCQKYAAETFPDVVSNYVDSGQVAVVFVDFPLQFHGLPALMGSEAAHCATEQDAYWPMHDAIFGSQATLSPLVSETDEGPVRDELVRIAIDTGLDGDLIEACLEQQKYRPIVASLLREAMESGVQATPTLLVGEQSVPGFLPFQDLRPIIEEELARALNPEAEGGDSGSEEGEGGG